MIGLGLNAAKTPTTNTNIVKSVDAGGGARGSSSSLVNALVLRHDYKDRPVELCSSGAASFTASANDSITTSNDTGLRPGAGSFSVSCWVNSTQKGTSSFALGKADNTNTTAGVGTGFALYLGNGGTDWVFWVGDGTDRAITATTTEANANQWYHLCGIFDTSGTDTVRLYVDGVLINSSAQALDTVDVSNNLEIGRIAGVASNDWDGYICNVGFWKGVVLTQPQIKSIMLKDYAALSASEKRNLVSWWNLDSTVSEDYETSGSTTHEQDEPSTITGLVLDNHDTTFTAVSVTNGDFTSGSGAAITGWTNDSDSWTKVNDTIVSGASKQFMRQSVLTNGVAHKAIIRAKRTTAGSAASLRVYFGANNYAQHALTSDFAEYIFHGIQQDDTTLFLYNAEGDVTIDSVELYKYNGNTGTLA